MMFLLAVVGVSWRLRKEAEAIRTERDMDERRQKAEGLLRG